MNYNNKIIELIKSSKKENEAVKYILGQVIQEVGERYINDDEDRKEITIEIQDIQDFFDADYFLHEYKGKVYDRYSFLKKDRELRLSGDSSKADDFWVNSKESFNLKNYKKRLKEFKELGKYFKTLGFNVKLHYDKDIDNHSVDNPPSRWWMIFKIKL